MQRRKCSHLKLALCIANGTEKLLLEGAATRGANSLNFAMEGCGRNTELGLVLKGPRYNLNVAL